MILAITSLGKEPSFLELSGNPADFVEFADSGISTPIRLHLDVTPLSGDSHLVQGQASGSLAAECGRCLEPISLPFSVGFNLLLDRQDPVGVEWVDDDEQGVEDYQAHLGPDVTEIPLQSIIAEQLVLNYNLHPLPDLDAAGRCVQCGRTPIAVAEPKKKVEGVDPRWAKLEALKDLKGSKVDGPADGSK
jgi:uncharacterized protein